MPTEGTWRRQGLYLFLCPQQRCPHPTLVKFQRWMKCRATSRAALPCTTEEMSCQGILGVVYLSMKSTGQESMFGPPQTKDTNVEKHGVPLLKLKFLGHGTEGCADELSCSCPQSKSMDCNGIIGPRTSQREFCCFFLAAKPK